MQKVYIPETETDVKAMQDLQYLIDEWEEHMSEEMAYEFQKTYKRLDEEIINSLDEEIVRLGEEVDAQIDSNSERQSALDKIDKVLDTCKETATVKEIKDIIDSVEGV